LHRQLLAERSERLERELGDDLPLPLLRDDTLLPPLEMDEVGETEYLEYKEACSSWLVMSSTGD
jgi:hypothetical protein